MEKRAKAESYIGFCLRARRITLGSGAVDCLKRGVHLIIVCSTASENSFRLAQKFARRHNCPLMICRCGLENAVHKAGCKIAAVLDRQRAGGGNAPAGQKKQKNRCGKNSKIGKKKKKKQPKTLKKK